MQTKTEYMAKEALESHLDGLREALTGHDYSRLQNVIFFNAESFYAYAKDWTDADGQTIDAHMDAVLPYAPLRLTPERFDLMLAALFSPDSCQQAVDDLMNDETRGEFLVTLCGAQSPETWRRLVRVCESIRANKE